MVTIEKIGVAECSLSGKEAEGVYCNFTDGSFRGFLSWRALRQLVKLKTQSSNGTSAATTNDKPVEGQP